MLINIFSVTNFVRPCGIVLARNVDAISTSPMSELCELRRLRALEDSRLSPAKPSKQARPPKLLYLDGTQWRAARRAQARTGRKSMAERERESDGCENHAWPVLKVSSLDF